MGMQSLYFARIDFNSHDDRKATKQLEFMWSPSPSLIANGQNGQTFTGAFYDGQYGPPNDFCFDFSCFFVTPINIDPTASDYNAPMMVEKFLAVAEHQSQSTNGHDLMWSASKQK
jgi:hypothetical protein